jgi:hypothetical protein
MNSGIAGAVLNPQWKTDPEYDCWPKTTVTSFSVDVHVTDEELSPFREVESAPWLSDTKREIAELLDEHGCDNWDGDGAEALSDRTVAVATRATDDLPPDIPRPDVSVTASGEIDLTWFVVDGSVSLSIAPDGSDIVLTGMVGDGTEYSGCEPWCGSIPRAMKCCIEDLANRMTADKPPK